MPSHILAPDINVGRRLTAQGVKTEDYNSHKPIFCFEHMVDGFCVKACQKGERAEFADALFKRSKLTWTQLRQSPRDGLGLETIQKGNLKKKLPPSVTEDVTIISFKVNASTKYRMIGYQDGRMFRIIWVDPKGKIYNH